MVRRKKEKVIELYTPVLDSDIEIGTKIDVKLVDGLKVDIYGTVVYIHEKHFAFSYHGSTHENLAVLPLPTLMNKDNSYQIYKN